MPTDVHIGQGYDGAALQQAFPGQYRATEEVRTFDNGLYQNSFPGNASGHPRSSDFALTSIPGVGQVVVPVDHTMVGQMQAVYPATHEMAGPAGDWYGSMFGLNGLGAWEWVTKLLGGKPQSWFDDVNAIQNALSVANAQLNAIGKKNWETIASQVQPILKAREANPQIPNPFPFAYFPGFDWMQGEIDNQLRAMMVTDSHVPEDNVIAFAKVRIADFAPMFAYAKGLVPALKAAADAAAADMTAKLSKTGIKSPTAVGVDTFVEEVKNRSSALIGEGLSLTKLAIAGVVAVALAYLGSKLLK